MCVLPDTTEYSECIANTARCTREVAQGNVGAYRWLRLGFQLQPPHDLSAAVRDYTRALDQRAELPELAPALHPVGAQGVLKAVPALERVEADAAFE